MAYDNTLVSGVTTGYLRQTAGPYWYQKENGSYAIYVPIYYSSALRMLKADWYDETFSEVDSAGHPTKILLHVHQDKNALHMISTYTAGGPGYEWHYHRFNMETDEWEVANKVCHDNADLTWYTRSIFALNNYVVALYRVDDPKKTYHQLGYAYSTDSGSTWTDDNTWDLGREREQLTQCGGWMDKDGICYILYRSSVETTNTMLSFAVDVRDPTTILRSIYEYNKDAYGNDPFEMAGTIVDDGTPSKWLQQADVDGYTGDWAYNRQFTGGSSSFTESAWDKAGEGSSPNYHSYVSQPAILGDLSLGSDSVIVFERMNIYDYALHYSYKTITSSTWSNWAVWEDEPTPTPYDLAAHGCPVDGYAACLVRETSAIRLKMYPSMPTKPAAQQPDKVFIF